MQAFFVVFLYTALYEEETKGYDKIVLVEVRAASCKHSIEGCHVKSYLTNFTSHHTRIRHVGFLSTQSCIGKYYQNVPLLFIYFIPQYQITTE